MVENVWDYPRPPRVEASAEHVTVVLGGVTIVDTSTSFRVLETSHPPTYYLPRRAFAPGVLVPSAKRQTFCEFKGLASYGTLSAGGRTERDAAWWYDEPTSGFEVLVGHVALYPGRMDACFVDGERVQAQEGDFYGGWITGRVVGPFKGSPGTRGW